jgi:hypothetical protein
VELTDNNLLAENLHRLERQAAVVAAMLDFDNTELVQDLAGAWCPGSKRSQRVWLDWLRDCGDRWKRRPPQHPAGEDLGDLLLAWCRRGTRRRRRRT